MKTNQKTFKLDNSAIIHLAAMRSDWVNTFRVSVTLRESICSEVLQSAFTAVASRFPTIVAGIVHDALWYYASPADTVPKVEPDLTYLTCMSDKQISTCAMRVLYHENKIVAEIFHSLTDGYGGMIFLKTLVAEYLTQMYGISIPAAEGVLRISDTPAPQELEDSFLENGEGDKAPMDCQRVFRLPGEKDPGHTVHVTTAIYDTQELIKAAHSFDVSLTTFLTGVMVMAILDIQQRHPTANKKVKPIQVMVPVNLRKLFPSDTLRNFTLYTLPGIDGLEGQKTLEAVIPKISSQLKRQISREYFAPIIAANVQLEKSHLTRALPLPIKNLGLRTGYRFFGERNSCLSISNLGDIQLPQEMKAYVQRIEFMLTPRMSTPYNCGVTSYDGKLFINFTRNSLEPELEISFLTTLADFGYRAEVESNGIPVYYSDFIMETRSERLCNGQKPYSIKRRLENSASV